MARVLASNRVKIRDEEDCLLFGASGTDRVNLGSADIIGVGNISISTWIKLRNFLSNNARIFDAGHLIFYVNTTGRKISFERVAGTAASSAANSLEPGRWYHVLVTSTSAGVTNIYINGVLSGTANQSAGTPGVYSYPIIGNRSANDRVLTGFISHFSIWNRVLTAAEVLDNYLTGNLPFSCVGDYKFDAGSGSVLANSVGILPAGTITGATWQTSGPIKLRSSASNRLSVRPITGSTKFDGSTSVVKILERPIYNLINYSVSFWMMAEDQPDDKYILSNCRGSVNTPLWGIDYKKPAGSFYNLRFFLRDDSNNVLSGAGDITPQNLVHGKWYHVVITDAGGSLKCYINGVYQGTTLTYTRGTLTLDQTSIGSLWRTTVSNNWKGRLAQLKIFGQVLTAEQALILYLKGDCGQPLVASYALNDTPPTYVDSISAKNGTGTATTLTTSVPLKSRTAV